MTMGNRDAIEALKWHEKLFKQHWTEHRPEPLVMTDTQLMDFQDQYVISATRNPGLCVLICEEIGTVMAPTYRKALSLAAAILEEENS
jgi:hypothetical protein